MSALEHLGIRLDRRRSRAVARAIIRHPARGPLARIPLSSRATGLRVPLIFEWDAKKARANLRKHGVTFEEAVTVFGDPLSTTIADPLHSADENRFIIVGHSEARRVVIVAHSERGDRIRIISARPATRREKRDYANP